MKLAVAALLTILSVHSFAQEIIKTDMQVDANCRPCIGLMLF